MCHSFLLMNTLKYKFLAYIGENISGAGRVAGQLIDMITPKKVTLVVTKLEYPDVHHLTNRTEGFLNYFRKSGQK